MKISFKENEQKYELSILLDVVSTYNNRPVRISGVRKNSQKPSELKNSLGVFIQYPEKGNYYTECFWWIYDFIYLDKQGGFVSFEFNPRGEFVGKIND